MSSPVKQYTGFRCITHEIFFQPKIPKKGKNPVDAGRVRNVVEPLFLFY